MRCWKKKPINQSDSHKIVVCFTKISMFYIRFEGLKLPSDGKKGGKGFNALRIILNNSFQFCLITQLYIEHQSSTVGRLYAGKRISEQGGGHCIFVRTVSYWCLLYTSLIQFMGHLGRATSRVNLISAQDQQGRKQMYH